MITLNDEQIKLTEKIHKTFNPQPKPGKDHVKLKGAQYVKLANKVFDRDGWECIECGTSQNLTLAHRIHKGMGGSAGPGDTMDNCQTLCMQCHINEEMNINGKLKR